MALLDHNGLELPTRPIARRPDRHRDTRRPAVNDNRKLPPDPAGEVDCLMGVLPPQVLRDAVARARDIGTGADRVLIAQGAITETDYLHHFARLTGIAIETFSNLLPSDGLELRDDQISHAARSGLMPFRRGDELFYVIAPRHLATRTLMRAIANDPGIIAHLRITTSADFDELLLHGRHRTLAHAAAHGLREQSPLLSAAPRAMHQPHRGRLRRVATRLMLAGCLALPTGASIWFWSQIFALWFIAAIGLRLAAAFTPQRALQPWARLPDAELPVYTLIVALYREARCVDQLLRALDALDYSREKLDLILVIEADDPETRAAIEQFGPLPHLRVMVAPDIAPRTKPKALNCALTFARGHFIAVFDAEDQPDPGQLRGALDAFRTGGDDVACAQASLCVHHASDSLFTRMFAAEYAGQFDAVLPGFAAMRLPLPLGGSSNHFRTDALRAVGGWDAWNVTEDADLGLRLARFGYRAVTFASTTLEEAPITFMSWLKQRSRWMKGWMQTLCVHLRDPRQLWRDAGWRGIVTLGLMIGSHVASALAFPVFIGLVLFQAATGGGWIIDGLLTPLHFTALAAGLSASVVIGLRGLARRKRWREGWILLLTPLYWGCLSVATWRALYQLLRDPYRWEKTEHGLTRTKRRVKGKDAFGTKALSPCLTNTVSDRPPLRPARASG